MGRLGGKLEHTCHLALVGLQKACYVRIETEKEEVVDADQPGNNVQMH